jgi:hypothetical protein
VVPAFADPLRGIRHLAYGETVAPPQIDTLRDENCPICGEDAAYDGHKCPICGYVAPPSPFNDPDLGLASKIDLRQQQNDFNDANIPDADKMAEQQQGGMLVCNVCGTEFPEQQAESVDTDEAAPDVATAETEEGAGNAEGDVCPACGKGQLESQNELEDEEGAEGENPFGKVPEDPDDPEDGPPEEDEDPEAKDEGPKFGDPGEEEDDQPGVPVKSSDGQQDPDDDGDDDEDGPVSKKPSKTKR